MKRALGIIATCSAICFLNLAMLLVLGVMGGQVSIAGPQDSCGDVNGDGSIDISDPIALLSFIFEGQPLACAQPPDPPCPCWPPRPEDIVNLSGAVSGTRRVHIHAVTRFRQTSTLSSQIWTQT